MSPYACVYIFIELYLNIYMVRYRSQMRPLSILLRANLESIWAQRVFRKGRQFARPRMRRPRKSSIKPDRAHEVRAAFAQVPRALTCTDRCPASQPPPLPPGPKPACLSLRTPAPASPVRASARPSTPALLKSGAKFTLANPSGPGQA